MNTQDEKQHFRTAETGFVGQTELDELLLPLQTSRGALVVQNDPVAIPPSRILQLRNWLYRSAAEEISYRHGFLFVPVLIAAGVALWYSLPFTIPVLPLLCLGVIAALICLFSFHRPGLPPLILKAGTLLIVGMLLADFETRRMETIIIDTPVTTTITGTVERRELDARGNWRYFIALKSTEGPKLSRPPNNISLVARSRHEAATVGQTVTGKARLSPPSGPALPGLNDFSFSAFFDGSGATGFFLGAPKVMPFDPATADAKSLIEKADTLLYLLRSNIAQRIRDLIGGDAGAFAASIITDERRAISGETMEALRVSGLAHIVAISGLNMALAAGIFFVGMRTGFSLFPGFSQRWPVKKISAFAALLMTLAYYLISGFAVSAERAWLMMSIMLFAVLVDRPSISLRNVALSAIVITVLSPHEVMGPSFQMSFAATLALVAGYAFWSRWKGKRERLLISRPPWWLSVGSRITTIVGGVVVTSLIGGISTAIYSIEHFHRITTYGLAANLAAMPVMSLIVMPFALIGMLLMPFGLDAPFLKIMGYGMAMVIDIAKTVSSWGGDATIGRQHGWFLSISTAGFLLLCLFRTRIALIGLPFIIVGLILLMTEQQRTKPDILIYEDGSLVALLTPDAVATTKPRPSGFVYDQWARALPLPDKHIAPVMIDQKKSPGGDNDPPSNTAGRRTSMTAQQRAEAIAEMKRSLSKIDAFTCRKNAWCVAKSGSGVSIAVVLDTAFIGSACDVAHLVIASRRTSFDSCRSNALLISRDTLRRTGSMEIWLGDEGQPVLRAVAAMHDVSRPWTIHRNYDWYNQTFNAKLPDHIQKMLSSSR